MAGTATVLRLSFSNCEDVLNSNQASITGRVVDAFNSSHWTNLTMFSEAIAKRTIEESINQCEEDSSLLTSSGITIALLVTAMMTGCAATIMNYKSTKRNYTEKRKSEMHDVVKDFHSHLNEIKEEINQKHNLAVILRRQFPGIHIAIINSIFEKLDVTESLVSYATMCKNLLSYGKEDVQNLLQALLSRSIENNEEDHYQDLRWMKEEYTNQTEKIDGMIRLLAQEQFHIYHFFYLVAKENKKLSIILNNLDGCFKHFCADEIKKISNIFKTADEAIFKTIKARLETNTRKKNILEILSDNVYEQTSPRNYYQ